VCRLAAALDLSARLGARLGVARPLSLRLCFIDFSLGWFARYPMDMEAALSHALLTLRADMCICKLINW
jgi:hypothetical protein